MQNKFSLRGNNNTNSKSSQLILLENERFDWKSKKEGTRVLADLLGSFDPDYSTRALVCGSALEFNLLEADDMGKNIFRALGGKKQLSMANFCQLRTCPLCNARRSRKLAVMLSDCIQGVREDHPGVRFLFLTLAMKNCTGSELVNTIDHMMKSFNRLKVRRPFQRAIKGTFRTMEITYNERQNTYHPHFHVLLAVEEDYFKTSKNLYITQEQWVKMWSECLKVDYLATANIKRADKSKKAIAEVSKYAVKDTDYLKLAQRNKKRAIEVVANFTNALYKRRLVQAGGWFKEHWNEQKEDDLLHITDDGSTHSKWYARYRYGYQVLKDYFLDYVFSKTENGDVDEVVEVKILDDKN